MALTVGAIEVAKYVLALSIQREYATRLKIDAEDGYILFLPLRHKVVFDCRHFVAQRNRAKRSDNYLAETSAGNARARNTKDSKLGRSLRRHLKIGKKLTSDLTAEIANAAFCSKAFIRGLLS